MSAQRTDFARRVRSKFLSAQGIAKVVRDPTTIYRTIKTFATDRNLRRIPTSELLNESLHAIAALSRLSERRPTIPFAEWLPIIRNHPDVDELGSLLEERGSDKSTEHDYFEIYGSILHGRRYDRFNLLEIGLGTNNLAIQSNMGLGGHPGASLRAFRDWAPQAHIVGADIDAGILFWEDRIETYWVDQTNPDSLAALAATVQDRRFDLIIDDGLHLPHSNFNTIEALLPLLTDDGILVVEDIDPVHLDYWTVAMSALVRYDTYLVERLGGWMFLIRTQRRAA